MEYLKETEAVFKAKLCPSDKAAKINLDNFIRKLMASGRWDQLEAVSSGFTCCEHDFKINLKDPKGGS